MAKKKFRTPWEYGRLRDRSHKAASLAWQEDKDQRARDKRMGNLRSNKHVGQRLCKGLRVMNRSGHFD
jgi:hypothetical protein